MKDYSSLFMDVAYRTACESSCIKHKVGCVLVRDNRIIMHGYNGTVSKSDNCNTIFKGIDMESEKNRTLHREWSYSFEIHAEMNALAHAAKYGVSTNDTIMYCTHEPCNNCLKHLIQAGVKKVVYSKDHKGNHRMHRIDRSELLKFIKVEKF